MERMPIENTRVFTKYLYIAQSSTRDRYFINHRTKLPIEAKWGCMAEIALPFSVLKRLEARFCSLRSKQIP